MVELLPGMERDSQITSLLNIVLGGCEAGDECLAGSGAGSETGGGIGTLGRWRGRLQ
jgi:hypothetical protein